MDIDHEELRNERLKSPFEEAPRFRDQAPPGGGARSPLTFITLGIAVVGLLLGLGLAYYLYQAWTVQAAIQAEISKISGQIDNLIETTDMVAQRLETDQQRLDSMTTDLDVLGNKLGVTTRDLERARAEASRLRQEQQKNVATLNEQIQAKADALRVSSLAQETDTKFDAVNEQINTVQEDVTASRAEIEKTWQELKSLGLQLTDQGNLIATNSSGLDELRKRGERDYTEFNARKKQKLGVSGIVVELRNADQKRQRADLKLYYDDRTVEQKKVYTNNPLTFYVGRERILYEFVINEVRKDQILGYISTPRGAVPGGRALGGADR